MRAEQCWNAYSPIVLRFLLQTTSSREEQRENVAFSRTSSLLGRVKRVRAMHCWNACSPKLVILLCSPNTTLTRWGHSPNVSSGMLSSLSNRRGQFEEGRGTCRRAAASPTQFQRGWNTSSRARLSRGRGAHSTTSSSDPPNEADFQRPFR